MCKHDRKLPIVHLTKFEEKLDFDQKKHRSFGKIVRKVGWSDNTTDKIWDWNGNFHLNCGKFYNKMIAESMTGWIDFATNLGKVTNSQVSITTRMATYAMSVISFTKSGMRKGFLIL